MSRKGYKQSEEHKKKIGDAQRGNKNHAFGKSPWNKGQTGVHFHSEEWKKNHSLKLKGKIPKNFKVNFGLSGEKHPLWGKGTMDGRTRAKYAPRPRPDSCEVCGAIGKICLDHDHKTNKFRGWLCTRCNVAIGMVKDNSETLIALSEYLKKTNP